VVFYSLFLTTGGGNNRFTRITLLFLLWSAGFFSVFLTTGGGKQQNFSKDQNVHTINLCVHLMIARRRYLILAQPRYALYSSVFPTAVSIDSLFSSMKLGIQASFSTARSILNLLHSPILGIRTTTTIGCLLHSSVLFFWYIRQRRVSVACFRLPKYGSQASWPSIRCINALAKISSLHIRWEGEFINLSTSEYSLFSPFTLFLNICRLARWEAVDLKGIIQILNLLKRCKYKRLSWKA